MITKKYEYLLRITLLLRPFIVFFSLSISYLFLQEIFEVELLPFLWIFISSVILSFLFYFSLRKGKKTPFVYLIADTFLIISIMHFSGGPESVFSILFFLVIITSSFYLEREKIFYFLIILLLIYNLFLFLWTKGILKVPLKIEFQTHQILLRGYIYTLSFLLSSLITYFLSERARKGEREAEKADILAREILNNLGEIVLVKNKRGDTIFKNSEISDSILGEKNQKEISFDGKLFSLNHSSFELFDEKYEIYVLRDITKEKEIEQILKHKEKEKFLTELSHGLAHEIRNPLTVIQGAITTLSRINDEEKKKKLVELIKKESERIDLIVKTFYEYAKIKEIKREKLYLKGLIKSIAFEFGIKNLEFQNEKDFIEAEPHLIQIAIKNLLRNAIEAVKNDLDKVKIKLIKNKIIIEDSGEGITEEDLEKVKYPFYTTKPGGLGMGLPLAERICELHGFKLNLKSQKGVGTEAIIELN
ncbi:MAG: ATP-binding protein [Candidatus Hydrothermales bacterium]